MLSVAEIKRFIDEDISSVKKKRALQGQKYYNAEHDIMNYKLFYYDEDGNLVEDTTRSNIKISHPFFTELVDQLASYMLSFEENPIQAKTNENGLQEYLDEYFDEEFWSETQDLIAGANAKGYEYIYGYKSEENKLKFECADSIGVVEVRAKDTSDNCDYVINHYVTRIEKGKKIVRKIEVWSDKEVWFYIQVGATGKIMLDPNEQINPKPHVLYTDLKTGEKLGSSLGDIPFWRLDNNKIQTSGLKPIKLIIDDYDLHACALSNNLCDFDHPIYAISGYEGTDLGMLMQNLKTKKTVGMDNDGELQIKTVDIPYEARKEKLEEDEKNIYRFGMGLNTAGLKDTTATTNIAIKAAYSLLELKANKMTSQLKKTLKSIIKCVLKEINDEHDTAFKLSDVKLKFVRSLPVNESENITNDKTKAETQTILINNILNVAAVIGDEEVVKGICEVLDLDYEEIKDKLQEAEEEVITASKDLDEVITDEQSAEGSTEGPTE